MLNQKHYRPIPGTDGLEVKISVVYIKDTHNWYTGNDQKRGFYVSFTPVKRSYPSPGIVTEAIRPQSHANFRIFRQETKAFHRAVNARQEAFVAENIDTLAELYLSGDHERLAHFVTTGELLPLELPAAA